MAVKQQRSTKRPTKRAASVAPKPTRAAKAAEPTNSAGLVKVAASNGGGRVRRVRMGRLNVEVHEPAEKDPKKRVEAVERAATRIKTTAIVDTIHPGQEY
jgi:hypothetical protein